MGKRGPAPKPGSKRWKAGIYKNRLSERHEDGEIVMPPDLLSDTAAMEFWQTHAPRLIADNRLRPSMVPMFRQACRVHSLVLRLEKEIERTGLTIEGRGSVVSNPLCGQLRDARRDLLILSRDFGMTASAAARLPAEAPKEEDADEILLKKFLA